MFEIEQLLSNCRVTLLGQTILECTDVELRALAVSLNSHFAIRERNIKRAIELAGKTDAPEGGPRSA